MHALKLIKIGDAVGVILPQEVMAGLGKPQDGFVYLSEMPAGWVLTPHDPAIQDQIDAGHEFLADYRAALEALDR